MRKVSTTCSRESIPEFEHLEEWARLKVQGFIQDLLEEEVEVLLGRSRYERSKAVDSENGYRNGYGKPRRISLKTWTVEVKRPRVRNLEERFESRILPLFQRRTKEVGDLLPELYLHGLSQGDFELALRGVLGEGAPLSASSIQRLKAKWEVEYEIWKEEDLSELEPVYLWADGIWGALAIVYPLSKEQRCWNHKITNVLDKLPKKVQPEAKEYLCCLPYAQTRAECERLDDLRRLLRIDIPKPLRHLSAIGRGW
jgi:transposase-like protein